MASSTTPLLTCKSFYEDCPGCKQDKRNQVAEGIPYKNMLHIWLISLCSSLPISVVIPFLYFMIQDMHVTKSDDDIGAYTGYIDSAYMFGRAFAAVFWGLVADRYGRKPAIAIGLSAIVVLNTLFGLSTNFPMAIAIRLLLGLSNSLMGTMKAYASELTKKEYQALGISVVNTSWATALILGPPIGGYLSKPAQKYPQLFSNDSLFGRFPYFLPCLCVSLITVIAFGSYLCLPETLHINHRSKANEETHHDDEDDLESSSSKDNISVVSKDKNDEFSTKNFFKNWSLISTIILYCTYSIQDAAYTETFSLWAVSSKSTGGLSFSSGEVGNVLSISGAGLLIFQVFVYPPMVKWVGTILSTRLAVAISIPLLASYPLMTNLSGIVLQIVVNYASLMKSITYAIITTGISILINNSVAQHQRGSANGIAITFMSFFKALGPAAAGIIFAWGQSHQDAPFLPGDLMVFFALNAVGVVVLLMTFKPFLTQPSEKELKAMNN